MMDEELEKQKILYELRLRRTICQVCIQTVSEVPMEEPRRASALAEYQRQLAAIEARINEITGKPPDIVVGLKTAKLFPEVGK